MFGWISSMETPRAERNEETGIWYTNGNEKKGRGKLNRRLLPRKRYIYTTDVKTVENRKD